MIKGQSTRAPERGHRSDLARFLRRSVAFSLSAAALVGCATLAQPGPGGRLKGKLIVQWVDEHQFAYLPDPKDPLTFVTTDNRTIIPQPMYTDGGSIPPILQPIPGFSPWGYGPAYIVHDWLFEQHRCGYPGADQISFDDSARILGEVIDTLMREGMVPRNPEARGLIEAGVRTPFARRLWDAPPTEKNCQTPAVASLRRAAPEGPTVVQIDFSRPRRFR